MTDKKSNDLEEYSISLPETISTMAEGKSNDVDDALLLFDDKSRTQFSKERRELCK